MGNFIYDRQAEIIYWGASVIGMDPRNDVHAIGWEQDGKIRAVTLYDTFSEFDCFMHMASDGTRLWLTRSYLYTAFAHPFIQWKKRRVTVPVPSKNTDSLRFVRHLGFEQEGVMRHAAKDDDIILLGMLRENCRFIPEIHRR